MLKLSLFWLDRVPNKCEAFLSIGSKCLQKFRDRVTNFKKIDYVSVRIGPEFPIELILPNHLHVGTLDDKNVVNRELNDSGIGVGATVLVLDHMGWSSGSMTVTGGKLSGVLTFSSNMYLKNTTIVCIGISDYMGHHDSRKYLVQLDALELYLQLILKTHSDHYVGIYGLAGIFGSVIVESTNSNDILDILMIVGCSQICMRGYFESIVQSPKKRSIGSLKNVRPATGIGLPTLHYLQRLLLSLSPQPSQVPPSASPPRVASLLQPLEIFGSFTNNMKTLCKARNSELDKAEFSRFEV
ncbi:hypothetical protein Tco_0064880 [Tanacetum coccineum]